MRHLKLSKGLSYDGIVKASKDKPDVYLDDDGKADAALETGYFDEVGDQEQAGADGEITAEPDYDTLESMTKAELAKYAASWKIDVSKCKTKADILEEINIAMGGSPTMLDLQRMP